MIDVNSIKNGMTLQIEGNIYQVVEFLHVKPGKGSAFMKTKLKNLRTGSNLERTFNTNVKFEEAHIDRKTVQYLYEAADVYYFMDNVKEDENGDEVYVGPELHLDELNKNNVAGFCTYVETIFNESEE